MTNLRPKLVPIAVPLNKLLLDPNNPRFLEGHSGRIEEADFADSGVQQTAVARMKTYRLDELEQSISTNGWQPVDMIFVRHLDSLPGHYVVLEGNRRLMALRNLRDNDKLTTELAAAVDPLSVLEVKSAATLEESRAQVAYLLGVRHHGSLKRWSPFAQARNIYLRYLALGSMTPATFAWNDTLAEKIGKTLSLDVKRIQERLRVYRAMEQLEEEPAIHEVGIKGRYYSLVREAVAPGQKDNPLKQYVVQDSRSFRLTADSVRRMDAVCHFSTERRAGAPISSPEEWRPFTSILKDTDQEKREAMIREVEQQKKAPSEVFARRQAELRQPRWDRWLEEVADLLKRLTIGSLDSSDAQSRAVAKRLATVLDALEPTTMAAAASQKVQ